VTSYVAGYEIGYRLQAAGFQRVALTVAGVPDGAPSQPYNATPFCVGRNGAAGDIVAAGPELQFEGNGRYTVSVSVGAGMDCTTAGETATGAFDVAARPAVSVAGEPVVHRAKPPGGAGFVGVTAPAPAGGYPGVQCALGAVVIPAADKEGARTLTEAAFPRPGDWACQARAVADGVDATFSSTPFAGDWSAPVPVTIRADFARATGVVKGPRAAKRVRFAFTAEFAPESAGGSVTVTLLRVLGCSGPNYKVRKVSTARGRFGPRGVTLALTRPRAGNYLGRVVFGGNRLVRKSEDPRPLLLSATSKRFGFAGRFPRCS
jgi:hypothetical protein